MFIPGIYIRLVIRSDSCFTSQLMRVNCSYYLACSIYFGTLAIPTFLMFFSLVSARIEMNCNRSGILLQSLSRYRCWHADNTHMSHLSLIFLSIWCKSSLNLPVGERCRKAGNINEQSSTVIRQYTI